MTVITQSNLNFKRIALPASHGGWGFLLEPILLGLLVAPSVAGGWLSLAAFGVFLLQQPLRLTLADWLKRRRYPRTRWAERFVALYGLVMVMSFGLALVTTLAPFWHPLLLAMPLASFQLYYDVKNRGRDLLPELAGALALGALAPAIALAAGWSLFPALTLWLILATRAITSIMYVRARLRLERGEEVTRWPVSLVHLLSGLGLSWMAYLGSTSWLVVIALVVLAGRAIIGLSPYRRTVPTRVIGFQEMGYGLLVVLLTAIGYRLT